MWAVGDEGVASFRRCLTFLRYLLSEYKGRFPESGTETGVGWGWDSRGGLWQLAEELLAPLLAARSYSCPRSRPLPHFSCWWSCLCSGMKNQVGGLIQMGKKKWKKVFVCLYFHMDHLSSVVYHVATNTWKSTVKRLVQGWEQVSGEKAGQGLLKLSWHWRWCHKPCYPNTEDVAFTRVWRCVSGLIFFLASSDTLRWLHWRHVWQHKREYLVKSWSWLKLSALCVKLC